MNSASRGTAMSLCSARRAEASAWPNVVTCGISRHDRAMFAAMVRRSLERRILCSSGDPGRPAVAAPSTSSLLMRPSGPVPATVERSTPSSFASRLTSGNAWAREPAPPGSGEGSWRVSF